MNKLGEAIGLPSWKIASIMLVLNADKDSECIQEITDAIQPEVSFRICVKNFDSSTDVLVLSQNPVATAHDPHYQSHSPSAQTSICQLNCLRLTRLLISADRENKACLTLQLLRALFVKLWDCAYGTGTPAANVARSVFNWDHNERVQNPDQSRYIDSITRQSLPSVHKFGLFIVQGSGVIQPMLPVPFTLTRTENSSVVEADDNTARVYATLSPGDDIEIENRMDIGSYVAGTRLPCRVGKQQRGTGNQHVLNLLIRDENTKLHNVGAASSG